MPDPVPVAPVRPSNSPWATVLGSLLIALAIAAHGWLSRPAPGPGPVPGPVAVNWTAEGKAFAGELAASHGAALKAAAADIRAGKALADVKKAEQADFAAKRSAAFDTRFVPKLDAIIPPNTAEASVTTDQRSRYATALEGIAAGEGVK